MNNVERITLFVVLGFSLGSLPVQAIYTGSKTKNISPPTHLIVKFRAELPHNPQARSDQVMSVGIATVDNLHLKYQVTKHRPLARTVAHSRTGPLAGVYLLNAEPGVDFETMAAEYMQLDEIEYAYPDYQVELYDSPDDPLYQHQWALNNTGQGYYHVERIEGDNNDTLAIIYGTADADIDAEEVFQSPPDATNIVVVAIVDTGVDWDHPDLAGMMWNNPNEIADNGIDDDHNGYIDDIVGWDFSGNDEFFPQWEDNDPSDIMGHGTHIAGIIAATINNGFGITGTVPTARIMALKAYPAMTISTLMLGVVYAADNGADVINMSWGLWFPSQPMHDVMVYAHNRGVVLIASAGNDGYEAYNVPASYTETIAVAATTSSDQVASFSTYGDSISLAAPGLSILSLRAEGTDMYGSNEPGVHIIDSLYYLASGTSMSGPYVAAAAAYVRSVSPGLSAEMVQEILQNTATDIVDPYGQGENFPGWDKYSGYGTVNLQGALAATPLVRTIINSPVLRQIVAGNLDITGSADGNDFTDYILEYGAGHDPDAWTEIIASSSPVTEGLLGSFNTAGLDGSITVRLTSGDNTAIVRLFVAGSPIAELLYPADGDSVFGLVSIVGSAVCPDFSHVILEYALGIEPDTWVTIDSQSSAVFATELTLWDVTRFIDLESMNLRLSVYSGSGLEKADTSSITVTSLFGNDDSWTVTLADSGGRSANYGDFDNDGQLEIVIGTHSGVQFFNADGTPKTDGVPVFPPDDYRPEIAVGNLDGDGIDDIVAIGLSGVILGFPSSAPAFQISLEASPLQARSLQNSATVFLRDINGDGLDEIHYFPGVSISYRPGYYYPYRPDGAPWGGAFPLPPSFGRGMPIDLDGDGIDEIFCYNSSTRYLMQFDTLGVARDSILIERNGIPLGLGLHHFVGVDIDNDDLHELILVGSFLDGSLLSEYYIWAFDSGLELKPSWPHNFGYEHWIGPEISLVGFGDLNSDGALEYFVGFNHFFTGLRGWNLDGTTFPSGDDTLGHFAELLNPGWIHDPIIADIDGDGNSDVLVGISKDIDLVYLPERILAYDQIGQVLPGFPAVVSGNVDGTKSQLGAPTVGDINQDGYLDFVYPWHDQLVFANLIGVTYDANKATRPMRRYNRRLNNTVRIPGLIEVVCGDVNADGTGPDVADLVSLVDYLFRQGPAPPNPQMADVDGSGNLNVADLTYMVDYLFKSGPEPTCL